jgi:hypothetical protein
MCCDGFWSNEAKGVTDFVENAGRGVRQTIENIIKDPLPTIEVLVLIAFDVPPPLASAAVTYANGGSLEDAAKAGVVTYVTGKVTGYAQGQASDAMASETGANYSHEGGLRSTPTTGSSFNAPLSSIAGKTAAGGTAAALTGKDVGQGLASGAISGVAGETGKYAGQQFEDPLTKRVVSGGARGATQAALTGGNILSEATKGAGTEALGYGVEKGINYVTDEFGLSNKYDKQIADLITKSAAGGRQPPQPAASPGIQISSATEGTAASPSAFGAADVALLESESPTGVGSKGVKKGGKYPWGDPEGTTALKEGLGV